MSSGQITGEENLISAFGWQSFKRIPMVPDSPQHKNHNTKNMTIYLLIV